MNRLPLIFVLLFVHLGVTLAAPKKPKPQLYVPMDYSTCGYHASEEPLPSVAVAAYEGPLHAFSASIFSRMAAQARARWLTAFFSSGVTWAKVLFSGSYRNRGS